MKRQPRRFAPPPGTGILVVDEYPSVLVIVTRVLENAGYTVLPASSYAEALTLWSEFAPFLSLVITDLCKPDESSPPLAAQLAAADNNVPVLVISSPLHEPVVRPLMRSPALDFLAKPFNNAQLLTRVGRLIANS